MWYDEHNLGAGQLLEEIQREVQARPVFVVLLSKNAFAAQWVRRETTGPSTWPTASRTA